jgi:hypothetical protein
VGRAVFLDIQVTVEKVDILVPVEFQDSQEHSREHQGSLVKADIQEKKEHLDIRVIQDIQGLGLGLAELADTLGNQDIVARQELPDTAEQVDILEHQDLAGRGLGHLDLVEVLDIQVIQDSLDTADFQGHGLGQVDFLVVLELVDSLE